MNQLKHFLVVDFDENLIRDKSFTKTYSQGMPFWISVNNANCKKVFVKPILWITLVLVEVLTKTFNKSSLEFTKKVEVLTYYKSSSRLIL